MPKFEEFSLSDLATAAEMTKRQMQYVDDAGLLPTDKGGSQAIRRAAMVGAYFAAGMPPIAAGRLAEATRTFSDNYQGEVPARLDDFWHGAEQAGVVKSNIRPGSENDFETHKLLLGWPGYSPELPLDGDLLIEIIDRKFVADAAFNRPNVLDADVDGFMIAGRIKNWSRGEVLEFEWCLMEYDSNQTHQIRKNSVARVLINASLAVRKAFMRLS